MGAPWSRSSGLNRPAKFRLTMFKANMASSTQRERPMKYCLMRKRMPRKNSTNTEIFSKDNFAFDENDDRDFILGNYRANAGLG